MRIYIIAAILSLTACSRSDVATVTRPGQPDMTYVPSDDAAMNSAIATARESLPTFRSTLAAPPPGASDFAVKLAFAVGKGTEHEHIWLLQPAFSATEVSGVINNEPVDATHLKLGQQVTAPIADISDWMYVENGLLRGGFTIRALLQRLPSEERAAALQEMPFRVE